MYLSELKLWNFRKYGKPEIGNLNLQEPHLSVPFNKGLNVLIGENDSGKTAIIDAIKLVLKTHAYEWIKTLDTDFFYGAEILRIELIFKGLEANEAKNFIEWLGWEEDDEKKNKPVLRLIYQVERKGDRILPSDIRAGMDENGFALNAEAREYLKSTYLKALRDAESDLIEKKNSRLSQILQEHELFKKKSKDVKHEFEDKFNEVNKYIEKWFKVDGKEKIKDRIDVFLKKFIYSTYESSLSLGNSEIKNILEKMSLGIIGQNNLGLGTMNRLYMAAELLHLKKDHWNGLKLCLVEELEAHLHPQAQMKIIEALQSEEEVQFILTTHSPNLASKVKLKNIILCKDSDVFPLGDDSIETAEPACDKYTKLDKKDYKYLERFLDVTKANLFFAKGVILVEGWSEEIILPVLASKLGYDLTEREISIVNVGSTAYLHFAKIFCRNDDKELKIPVSIITDLDNRVEKDGSFCEIKKTRKEEHIKDLRDSFKETSVRVEVSQDWTLEWCLLNSPTLSEHFKKSLFEVHSRTKEFKENSFDQHKFIAMLRKDNGHGKLDKVNIANHISEKIEKDDTLTKELLRSDKYLNYLTKSIIHACGDNCD